MLTYRFKCKIYTGSKNAGDAKTKLLILSKCAVCDSKKLRFVKEQEASGLLSSLGIKTGLDKIPIFGPFLF